MKRLEQSTAARFGALVAAALVISLGAGSGADMAIASPARHGGGQTASMTLRARMLAFQRQHGYLPLKGFDTLRRAKIHAAAVVAARGAPGGRAAGGRVIPARGGPKVGASWLGPKGPTPPDANGAVGPKSYIEITNGPVSIFERDGTLIATANLNTLTRNASGGDPMILWDPDTQRFYFSAIGPTGTIDWGFSTSNDPRSIPGDWCTYDTSYGFPQGTIPDYPTLPHRPLPRLAELHQIHIPGD